MQKKKMDLGKREFDTRLKRAKANSMICLFFFLLISTTAREGEACDELKCPRNGSDVECSYPNGYCDHEDGTCKCNHGWIPYFEEQDTYAPQPYDQPSMGKDRLSECGKKNPPCSLNSSFVPYFTDGDHPIGNVKWVRK